MSVKVKIGPDDNPQELLTKCIEERRIDVLRSLLSQIEDNADFSRIVDGAKTTVGSLLHLACANGDGDAVRTLLSAGANPCVQDDANKTPLQICTDDRIRTIFHQQLLQAIATKKLARISQLLVAGVPIDSVDSPTTANTALHFAASFADVNVAKMLIDGGSKVNQQNGKGETPLHDAIDADNLGIVKLLLTKGANPTIKNKKGLDCFQYAQEKNPKLLQYLYQSSVQENVLNNSHQGEDFDDISSIISFAPTTSASSPSVMTGQQEPNIMLKDIKIDKWQDWLWPQPKRLHIENCGYHLLPKDHMLKFYFDASLMNSCDDIVNIMKIANLCIPLLQNIGLSFNIQRWFDLDVERSPVEGVIVCAISPALFDHQTAAYTLSIEKRLIRLTASNDEGLRNALFSLVQIIRANPEPLNAATTSLPQQLQSNNQTPSSDKNPSLMPYTNGVRSPIVREADAPPEIRWKLPLLNISDAPDTRMRACLYDFTGCRILTVDTLCQIVSRLCLCKLNTLIVHFEVRPTDRFSLAYTGRDIFHLQRVCADLQVTLVPSLDLNSSYVESQQAAEIFNTFLNQFPNCTKVHFGAHASQVLLQHRNLLTRIKQRVTLIYLAIEDLSQSFNDLPQYCILCLSAMQLAETNNVVTCTRPICLNFLTTDVGYLCQSPENTVKHAILAARLADQYNVAGTIACDQATGCEIVPQSLSYMTCASVLGVSWNRGTDMKKYAFLIPHICAKQILLDSKVTNVCIQMLALGHIEHELNRLSVGTSSKKPPLSVFVQMLLNPDNLALERLTPVAFKKVRIELRKIAQSLTDMKKDLPYNFELALTLAEVQLVTDLMILAARLGQVLCTHGWKPATASDAAPINPVINVGVSNLPITVRTDLANSLLELRTKFQHTWLSRNLPSTLPNSLKIFDNLFKALLPQQMENNGYL